jgi:Family of unknown function (DUF6699)
MQKTETLFGTLPSCSNARNVIGMRRLFTDVLQVCPMGTCRLTESFLSIVSQPLYTKSVSDNAMDRWRISRTKVATGEPFPDQEPQLHEALNGLRHHRAAWDISEDPVMARCITSRGVSEPIPAVVLSQPATQPAIRNMRIISDLFPWDIRIHIPGSVHDRVITVGLVLEAIHGVMQEDLAAEEWETKSTTLKKRIHMEMCARLSRVEPSLETKVRVLKTDCLLGSTEFMGLESVSQGEDATWQLSLGPPVR